MMPMNIADKIGADAKDVRKLLDRMAESGDLVTCDAPLRKYPNDREFRIAGALVENGSGVHIRIEGSRHHAEQAKSMASIGPKTPPAKTTITAPPPAPVVAFTPSANTRAVIAKAATTTDQTTRPRGRQPVFTLGLTRAGIRAREKVLAAFEGATAGIPAKQVAKHAGLSQRGCYTYLLMLLDEGVIRRFGMSTACVYAGVGTVAESNELAAADRTQAFRSTYVREGSNAQDTGRRAIAAIKAANTPLTLSLLAESLGRCHATVSTAIRPLEASGEIVRIGHSSHCRFGLPGMEKATQVTPLSGQPLLAKAETANGVDAVTFTPAGAPIGKFSRDLIIAGSIGHKVVEPTDDIYTAAAPDPIATGAPTDKERAIFLAYEANRRAEFEIGEVLDLLRGQLDESEYRGYLRGTLIALALRGHPEDLKRQQLFGRALAEVAND
jgi:DNA-binding Lrp family transcriptional regulator